MLSEEEKKVINSLENEYKKLEEKGNILFPLYKQQTKILLNLITKLQKENEEKDKRIDLILNEQIQDGYLVNFNNLEEAREYYNKLAKEKEE